MKKSLSIILSVIMVFTVLPSFIINTYALEQGSCGKNVKWSFDSEKSTLTISGNGKMESSENLASFKNSIKKLTIENGVTSICEGAFKECENLEEVLMANTVTEISASAFDSCVNLKKVKMSEKITTIGSFAFFYCINLSEFSLPASLKNIGNDAFEYIGNSLLAVKTIYVPCSVTEIGSYAFNGIDQLYYSGKAKDKDGNRWGAKGLLLNDSYYGHIYVVANCLNPQYCTVCGKTYGEKQNHNYINITKPATTEEDGQIESLCLGCGDAKPTRKIYKVNNFKLSATSYTFTNSVKTPGITVKDSAGNLLVKNKDYSVTYSDGRKNVGKYQVKITLMNRRYGDKTLSFVIKPKGTSLSTITPLSKGFTVKWKRQATQTTGYQLRYSLYSSMANCKVVNLTSNKTVSKTLKSLKSKKKYYIQVRTYKTVSGVKYYSEWSGKKAVTTKK